MGRKEKKAEEKRILAELDAAVKAERGEEPSQNEKEQELHCRRCRAVMKEGVCPTCGFRIYTPMSEEKRKKIKGIATVVCLAIFIVLFALIKR